MKPRSLISASVLLAAIALNGCSTVSGVVSKISEKKKNNALAHNPEQMRVVVPVALFQPVSRVDIPQFQGLQTPMVAGRQRIVTSNREVRLPNFTPVKVLSSNDRYALVELASGQRGYVQRNAIASESAILAEARQATPLYPAPEPMPMPMMDPSDGPVDQAMLNNIDNIPLPESETQMPAQNFQTVDGVLVRKPEAPDASAAVPSTTPALEPLPAPAAVP